MLGADPGPVDSKSGSPNQVLQPKAGSPCVETEGGRAEGSTPKSRFGAGPISRRTVAGPLGTTSQERALGAPSTATDWTYLLATDAPGASMTRSPPGRLRVTFSNTGLPTTTRGVPGFIGYRPAMFQTSQP